MMVHALFFDPSYLEDPEDTDPHWMMDELSYHVIVQDRKDGADMRSGCWVTHWILVPV